MPGQRRIGIGAYTQRRGGRVVQIRQHTKQITYGGPGGAWGRGVFSLSRATRHVTGRPAKGKRPSPRGRNRWSKKKTALVVALGVGELVVWLVFRGLGLGLGLVAILLSTGAIGLNRAGSSKKPARRRGGSGSGRRPPGVKASRPLGETVVASTKGRGTGAGKAGAEAASVRRTADRPAAKLFEPPNGDAIRGTILRRTAKNKDPVLPHQVRFTRQGGIWLDARREHPHWKPVKVGEWGPAGFHFYSDGGGSDG